MKKIMKVILGVVVVALIIIVVFWVSIVYVSDYKITTVDISVSPDETYELVLQAVGEADFPFGSASGRLILYEGESKISKADFELFDDGGCIRSSIWEVTWRDDCVEVILCGDEQFDERIILYFDGRKERNQLTENTGEPEKLTDMESDKKDSDIYDYVLAQYRDMVQHDFYTDLLEVDMERYDNSFGEDIGSEIRNCKKSVFYAFYDIDGNGTNELVIAGGNEDKGVANPSFSLWNYDLYGYDGTKAVHIFPGMDFGYSTNFSLYENGMIEVFYSASATESGSKFYKIGSDGFTPELIDSFAVVARLDGEEPVYTYYQHERELTEEEYRASIQRYGNKISTELDWIQVQ